jgi:hypothetical protein
VRLTRADLTGANLFLAHLSDADLTGANLTKAHLASANLTGADLTGADFTSADLRRASWPADAAVPKGWHRDAESGRLNEAGTDPGPTAPTTSD